MEMHGTQTARFSNATAYVVKDQDNNYLYWQSTAASIL